MKTKDNVNDLIDCYLNEKACKNILPYEGSLVDTFYNYVIEQNELLRRSEISKILRSIYELEIERIKFILKEYLLIRIKKLRENFFCDVDFLSCNEKLFYSKYLAIIKDYGILTENTRTFKSDEIVGFMCLEDIHEIMFDNNTIEMFKDDIFVGPLNDVYELLLDKKIKLI